MSRKFFLPFMVIALLSLMAISAAAAQEHTPTLVSTEYIEGKGLVMKFEGAEDLDPGPLEGTVVIGDKVYDMNCMLKNDGVLVCVAWVPKSHYGDHADVYLGDFFYEVLIVEPRPKPEPPAPSQGGMTQIDPPTLQSYRPSEDFYYIFTSFPFPNWTLR